MCNVSLVPKIPGEIPGEKAMLIWIRKVGKKLWSLKMIVWARKMRRLVVMTIKMIKWSIDINLNRGLGLPSKSSFLRI